MKALSLLAGEAERQERKEVRDARTDEVLTRLAQQGELEAFTALYERYLPIVYRRVRYVVPPSDVEDVTQEIFISMLKSLQSFKGDATFRTWLRTITDRRVADYYKGAKGATFAKRCWRTTR